MAVKPRVRNAQIKQIYQEAGFTPNPQQERAILHAKGPLFLTAGPGSGKTRVLLWRTLGLIVDHGIKPEEIFLSTFTEKAAQQLKEGLRTYLGAASAATGRPYDISKMYVGTVHSLCQKLMTDRRFHPHGHRPRAPALLDELDQYLHLSRAWNDLAASFGDPKLTQEKWNEALNEAVTKFISDRSSTSKHNALSAAISLFNRFSEESLTPAAIRKSLHSLRKKSVGKINRVAIAHDPLTERMVDLYEAYLETLAPANGAAKVDFSLLQQAALKTLNGSPHAGAVFRHVIIDEYQDTNAIQEQIFFALAKSHGNLCVVGDDDQALYRFRGATVENFVEFPDRCMVHLKQKPTKIDLNTNYRSSERIVTFYRAFMDQEDWSHADPKSKKEYRIAKKIAAHRQDKKPAVIASTAATPDEVAAEIAILVDDLLKKKKITDPNQIAFLFPSLKAKCVGRMQAALEDKGLKVYAPRASRFLELPEITDFFGIVVQILGKPDYNEDYAAGDYKDFHDWIRKAETRGKAICKADASLTAFVTQKKDEIATVIADFEKLTAKAKAQRWKLETPYEPGKMKRPLADTKGISDKARQTLSSQAFEKIAIARLADGNPFALGYVINRATSIDWSLLDLFYQLGMFKHFKAMLDLAEDGDEGPICNLGLLTQYLAKFVDHYNATVVSAKRLQGDRFRNLFFMSYIYALFRRGESEFEDAQDPFPKGRIPFLTIHQSKGLEFPVVVLGNLRKDAKVQRVEEIVRPLLNRQGEPLDRSADFDVMRMYYVALSRAKNLLVLAHFRGRGQYINKAFRPLLDGNSIPRIPDFKLTQIASATETHDAQPKAYSYTADYLLYHRCPRQYMLFRKYGFVPSRGTIMLFGSLVHRTLEDLHHLLIGQRSQP